MVSHDARRWTLLFALGCACSTPAPAAKAPASPPVESPRRVEGSASPVVASAAAPVEPGPTESAGFAEALAHLRPPAGAEALSALERAPQDGAAYADAALAYAPTDVPVMTLIWGLSYLAMGGGKQEPAVAQALAKVLAERVIVKADPDSDRMDYNVRFAPGQMPVREDAAGAVEAPLAHAFEGLFSATLVGFRPPWSIEEFYDVLSSWAGFVSTRGTPLDGALELNGWLVALAKAGHLEAFCHRLLGSAFPTELKAYRAENPRALPALNEYLKTSAFVPSRLATPDLLVRLK